MKLGAQLPRGVSATRPQIGMSYVDHPSIWEKSGEGSQSPSLFKLLESRRVDPLKVIVQ